MGKLGMFWTVLSDHQMNPALNPNNIIGKFNAIIGGLTYLQERDGAERADLESRGIRVV